MQDLSIKYYKEAEDVLLSKAFMDRNGVIQIMSSQGVLRTHNGQFLYPGTLIADRTYRPMMDKNIVDLATYKKSIRLFG